MICYTAVQRADGPIAPAEKVGQIEERDETVRQIASSPATVNCTGWRRINRTVYDVKIIVPFILRHPVDTVFV